MRLLTSRRDTGLRIRAGVLRGEGNVGRSLEGDLLLRGSDGIPQPQASAKATRSIREPALNKPRQLWGEYTGSNSGEDQSLKAIKIMVGD